MSEKRIVRKSRLSYNLCGIKSSLFCNLHVPATVFYHLEILQFGVNFASSVLTGCGELSGIWEISTLFPRKITPAVSECDVFNTECIKQNSSHGGWGGQEKEDFKVQEWQLFHWAHKALKWKANQMKSRYFRRSKK